MVTGPAKIGHEGSQNLITFQTFFTHNFLLQHDIVTKFSEFIYKLYGFTTQLAESKCIPVLRYVSFNDMVYFIPIALFSQAWSQLWSQYVSVEYKVNVKVTKPCYLPHFRAVAGNKIPVRPTLLEIEHNACICHSIRGSLGILVSEQSSLSMRRML